MGALSKNHEEDESDEQDNKGEDQRVAPLGRREGGKRMR